MAGYSIKDVEDAILRVLKPLWIDPDTPVDPPPVPPRILKTLKTYQGELEKKEDTEHLIEQIKGVTPAIFTIYAGSKFQNNNQQVNETMFWGLFTVEESLRGPEWARRGSKSNVGVYEVIRRMNELLVNNSLGLNLLPLEIQSQDGIYFDNSIAIYSSLFMTEQSYIQDYIR